MTAGEALYYLRRCTKSRHNTIVTPWRDLPDFAHKNWEIAASAILAEADTIRHHMKERVEDER